MCDAEVDNRIAASTSSGSRSANSLVCRPTALNRACLADCGYVDWELRLEECEVRPQLVHSHCCCWECGGSHSLHSLVRHTLELCGWLYDTSGVPYAVIGLATFAGTASWMRGEGVGWLAEEESNSVIGLVELGGEATSSGGGVVEKVRAEPAVDPDDPV